VPVSSEHFSPKDMQRSNYDLDHGNWMLNASELYLVAEWLRRAFAGRLAALRIAGQLSDKISSYGLAVNSTWRNPERNECVGGVRNSNHQFGRALDICPAQASDKPALLPERKVLLTELFKAGEEFLEELVARNGASHCRSVEILLEKGAKLLWSFRIQNGSIQSSKGGAYEDVVGTVPADRNDAIFKAAEKASHVHIGWKSTNADVPLLLPPVESYDDIAPSLSQPFRNMIVIAKEDQSIDPDAQLPLNHIANTLKKYLEIVDPGTPVDIIEVGDAIQYLQTLNAFRTPAYKIRYFFSFSHAWPAGLKLTHFQESGPGAIPYERGLGDSGPQIHDPELFNLINFLYGASPSLEDSDLDLEQSQFEPLLPVGENDYTQIKTHQIRVSNLIYLPPDALKNLQMTLQDCEGIFAVGCRTAEESDERNLDSYAQALANISKKTAHGAAYYSKVFHRNGEGNWEEINLTRTDPTPDNPVVLVPGSLGGLQYIKYLYEHGGSGPRPLAPFPEDFDLINLYRTMLVPCHPVEE
jgi:hypothetical protein